MKTVVVSLLGALSLAAHAQEQQVPAPQVQAVSVAAESSFSKQSQQASAQLPDVNEQEGADSVMPAFASHPQNQALMLGGLLAMGFMVRRRREH